MSSNAAPHWSGRGGLTPDSYLTLHGLSFSFLWMEMITITVWMVPLGVAIVRTGCSPSGLDANTR